MPKLPDLPVRLKPLTPDELEEEERRNRAALRRAEAAFGDDGLIAQYRAKGDPLLAFIDVARLVIELMPDKTLPGLTHLFVMSTKLGAFPVSGTRLGPRDTVKDLFDFFHLRAADDLDFTPTLLMIEGAPLPMQARKSIWPAWLRSQSLPVPPLLTEELAIDQQPAQTELIAQTEESAADPSLPSETAGTEKKTKPTPEKFVDDYIAEAGAAPSMRELHRVRDDDEQSLAKYGCTLKGEPGFGYGSLDQIYRTKGLDKNPGGKPAKLQRRTAILPR